jgi:hypothetical protein
MSSRLAVSTRYRDLSDHGISMDHAPLVIDPLGMTFVLYLDVRFIRYVRMIILYEILHMFNLPSLRSADKVCRLDRK